MIEKSKEWRAEDRNRVARAALGTAALCALGLVLGALVVAGLLSTGACVAGRETASDVWRAEVIDDGKVVASYGGSGVELKGGGAVWVYRGSRPVTLIVPAADQTVVARKLGEAP